MSKIPELFGSMVFGDAAMKERLPKETYKALKKTMKEGRSLQPDVANVVDVYKRQYTPGPLFPPPPCCEASAGR